MEEFSESNPDGLPSPQSFASLHDCIQEIIYVLQVIANPVTQGEFTDGSIRHELKRLHAAREGIFSFITRQQRRREFFGILQCFKEACEHFNTAASAYQKSKQRNRSFYQSLGHGQESLEQMLDEWDSVCHLF